MEIESIRHKEVRRLAETGNAKGLIEAKRVRNMLLFINGVADFSELARPPNFGFHELTGDRKGTFAMAVTRNWRMTFTKVDDQTIADIDLEDYH